MYMTNVIALTPGSMRLRSFGMRALKGMCIALFACTLNDQAFAERVPGGANCNDFVQNGEFELNANYWQLIEHAEANWYGGPGWDGVLGHFFINHAPGQVPETNQAITGLSMGTQYIVSGYYKRHTEAFGNPNLLVMLNDDLFFEAGGTVAAGWTFFSFPFTANATSILLRFLAQVTGDDAYYIDNIKLEPVECVDLCGNGILDLNEICDDGNKLDCDGCRSDCSAVETGCGDGFVCGTEECDDGNNIDYDGCSALCISSDLDYECRIVSAPSTQEQVAELPSGIAAVGTGDTFFVEFWATDSGEINTGLISVYADLDHPESSVTCEAADGSTLFSLFPGGTCESLIVNELGGSQLDSDVGVQPNWARIAAATLTAVETGTASFSLLPAATESSAHGRGIIAPENIQYGSCSVEIVCPCIYDLDNNCNVAGGDLGLFAPCWNLNDADLDWDTFDCHHKDFDMSGTVSGGDLGWFAGSWNTTCDLIDPIADYPAQRQCTPPLVCPLMTPLGSPAFTGIAAENQSKNNEDSVILSLRLDVPQHSKLPRWRRNIASAARLREGERIRAEVWVKDTSAMSSGLTVVYVDLNFDPSQLEVVSIKRGETFSLFFDPTVAHTDGVVHQLGGATLDYGIAANSWVQVATVELEALIDAPRVIVSLRPSDGEAVSRYGRGLVPTDQIQVISQFEVKSNHRLNKHEDR